MTFSKLIAFSLLITLNALASEVEMTTVAPPSLVEDFYDYCSEIKPDDEGDEYLLNCVNAQLEDAGFDNFSSLNELLDHKNKKDDE